MGSKYADQMLSLPPAALNRLLRRFALRVAPLVDAPPVALAYLATGDQDLCGQAGDWFQAWHIGQISGTWGANVSIVLSFAFNPSRTNPNKALYWLGIAIENHYFDTHPDLRDRSQREIDARMDAFRTLTSQDLDVRILNQIKIASELETIPPRMADLFDSHIQDRAVLRDYALQHGHPHIARELGRFRSELETFYSTHTPGDRSCQVIPSMPRSPN